MQQINLVYSIYMCIQRPIRVLSPHSLNNHNKYHEVLSGSNLIATVHLCFLLNQFNYVKQETTQEI